MRFYKNPQGKLGEINILKIKLDKKSQDEEARERMMQIHIEMLMHV